MESAIYVIVILALCYIYVFVSSCLQQKKCNFLHETSVALILGVIVGLFLFFFTDILNSIQLNAFIRQLVFLVLLPMMFFEDGYNIKKRKFFQNIFYSNIYGIIATIIQLVFMIAILFLCNHYGVFLDESNNGPIILRNWHILAMTACLTSIDTVVGEKIINPQHYPKLFSIIIGESIYKDTIAVTLFDTITLLNTQLVNANDISFDAITILILIGRFLEIIICSILIGVIGALITTFLFKHFRFLISRKEAVAEVALVFITGYFVYVAGQAADFSGIISMLFCGLTLSHLNVYNLSHEGKQSTKTTISVLALLSEGLLFFLVGAFVFDFENKIQNPGQQTTNSQNALSWPLLLITLFSLLFGRLISFIITTLIFKLFKKKGTWTVNYYELQILFFAGLVKGAVPFSLILTIPNSTALNAQSIILTVTYIVALSTLFMNSLLPKIFRNRLKRVRKLWLQDPLHPSVYQSFVGDITADDNDSTFHENKHFKTQFQKYIKKFEEGCIKPFFIFNYYERKEQIIMDKISQRRHQYNRHKIRFAVYDNILDPQDQQNNHFIDLRLDSSSQVSFEEHERVVTVRLPRTQIQLTGIAKRSQVAKSQFPKLQKLQKLQKQQNKSQIPSSHRKTVQQAMLQNFKASIQKRRFTKQ